ERFLFFTRVTKKFEHCISFLNNVITNLTTKQSNFVAERAYALEEIMKLEKEMPEVITFLNKSTPIIEEEINVLEI
ncbi:MAG: hypothetical protein IJW36_03185, partial [Clostridia bacterium]|nr:hypothetical protein [Clostridia bacterium]